MVALLSLDFGESDFAIAWRTSFTSRGFTHFLPDAVLGVIRPWWRSGSPMEALLSLDFGESDFAIAWRTSFTLGGSPHFLPDAVLGVIRPWWRSG